MLYFAGHGVVHRMGSREEGYVLPHDADPDDVVTRGISMTEIGRWVEAIDAATIIVCLDCCHSGRVTARETQAGLSSRDMAIRPALFQGLGGSRGRYLIASCDEGQVSIESEALGHGLFTYHLLRGMKGAADRDHDGKVGVHELFEYVASAVEFDAKKLGYSQRPWHQSAGPGGAFVTSATAFNHDPDRTVLAIEGLPVGEGPQAVAAAAEEAITRGQVERAITALDWLSHNASPASVAVAFLALAHTTEAAIREKGRNVLRAIGWDRVVKVVLEMAGRGQGEGLGTVLDGLAAFEAHRDVVALLDQLVVIIQGETRDRVVLLLERKKLALDLESIAEVFRELKSPFRLEKVLGQGLITAAYLAHDAVSGLDVVVRVLRAELAGQAEARTRFLDLSRRSMRMHHENLVLTREVRSVPEKQLHYVVRDHVPGITLQRLIDSGHVFSGAETRATLRQVLSGLGPFHENGMAHGGVKPTNIFLTSRDRVVLGDPAPRTHGLTLEMARLSYDYRYAPPEQFRGDGALGPRADFYSLGCVAYQLCCGSPPFVGVNPFEIVSHVLRDQVPPLPSHCGLFTDGPGATFLSRLLDPAPEGRFPSIDAVHKALDDLEAAAIKSSPPARATSHRTEEDIVEGLVLGPAPPRPELGLIGDSALANDDLLLHSIISFHSGATSTADPPTIDGEGIADDESQSLGFTVGAPEPPRRIGRYEVLEQIGKGGMGAVYRAHDRELDRMVAIKLAPRQPGVADTKWQRFRREAMAVARLDHPNIVKIYDVGELDDAQYLVLELVDGGDLRDLLSQGPLPPDEAARLVITLASAVDFAHERGVLHRDLKPANILLTPNRVPKISDFGLAKFVGGPEPMLGMEAPEAQSGQEDMFTTFSGQILGTPTYMAPEQTMGKSSDVGRAADVFSLGVVLYECLAGRRPFTGMSVHDVVDAVRHSEPVGPEHLRAEVPAVLGAICVKCLAKLPSERYRSARALAEDLERFLAGRLPRAAQAPPSPPTTPVPPARKTWFRWPGWRT